MKSRWTGKLPSQGGNGHFLLEIPQRLLTHLEEPRLRAIEVDDQDHDRGKGEDERPGDEVGAS